MCLREGEHRARGDEQQHPEGHGGAPLALERLADPRVRGGEIAVDEEQCIAVAVPGGLTDLAAHEHLHRRRRQRGQEDRAGPGQQPAQALDQADAR